MKETVVVSVHYTTMMTEGEWEDPFCNSVGSEEILVVSTRLCLRSGRRKSK